MSNIKNTFIPYRAKENVAIILTNIEPSGYISILHWDRKKMQLSHNDLENN